MHKVETSEWLQMLSRMIRAAGRRVADADEHQLAQLAQLQREFDAAMQAAVDGQISSGRSWTHIGNALGTTKQAAFKRFGCSKNIPALLVLPEPDGSLSRHQFLSVGAYHVSP